MSRKNIRLLSISDCREKNGIVTFLKIFKDQQDVFARAGYEIATDCYRDFCDIQAIDANEKSGMVVPSRFRLVSIVKSTIKTCVLRTAPTTFLLFCLTFALRGFVVLLRSRLRGRADIYLHQDFITAFWGRFLLPANAKRALVLHSGDDPLRHLFIWFRPLVGTVFEFWIRKSFSVALNDQDTIVTLNKGFAADLRRQDNRRIVTSIYNTCRHAPAKVHKERNASEILNIVAVGSLQHVKGFDLLIEAVSKLSPQHRAKMKLKIIGEGGERVHLEGLIRNHGLSRYIQLLGTSNDVTFHLNCADVFILTSRDEGLPIAVIEALQAGLPVLSTKVGAVPEVLDSSACIYMEKTAADIAEKLKDLLDGCHDLRAMSTASRRIYDDVVSMERFVANYQLLFEQLSA